MNNQILALSRRLQHPVRLCLAALLCATAAPLLRAQTTNEFTSSTIIVATNTAYDGENIVIDGCTLTVDGTHTFNSISLSNGAVLTHQPATAVQTFSLVLTVTNNVFVDSTSSINVSGCGYLPGYTLDDSTNGAANNTAGGSYGGLGGLCCGSTSDAVYGDFHYPNELGSGSGTYNSGGSGGGLVQITAATAQVDGMILANGENAYDGGSGGGILLTVGTLSGSGQISANGGNGAGNDGGGGGRVAIYYDTSTFDLSSNVTANGGAAGSPGSVGTVYLQQTGSPGQLVIDNHGTPVGQWTPLGVATDTVFKVDSLFVAGTNVIVEPQHQMPVYAGSISITNGAVLTHQPTTAAQAYSLLLTVTNNLLVDAASSINVSGRGYLPGYTLDDSTNGAANNTAGGSYGGLGGLCCGSTSDAVYGDFHYPNELGSGSGTYNGGGSGGGLVQITAATAQVNGTILANGGNSFDGGSGGGILLTVGTLSGAGQISANGGSGGGDDGGGGGRVAIYYGTNTFNLSNNVTANGGAAGSSGSVGTVYLQQTGSPGQLVIDNHGTPVGQWTPLGVATNTAFLVDNLLVAGTNVIVEPQHQMPVYAGSISITNGAEMTHQPTTTAQPYSLLLTVTNNLLVDGTSTINVSGHGYLPGYTLGDTNAGGATSTAGGSYGGLGGICCSSTGNAVYGDYHNPDELGSGSGPYNNGASGGGLVQITAGTARVDGTILANGGNGYDGGSGGGILLNIGTLTGAGQINANGGAASADDGGGGGRVAVYYGANTFNLSSNVTASGGRGGSSSGSAGTVYLQQTGALGQLVINNDGTANGQWTPLGQTNDVVFSADALVLSGSGTVAATISGAPIQAGSLSLVNGAVLTHQPTTAAQAYSLLLTVTNNLLVDAASSINVSERGYLPGYTLDDSTNGAANNTAGGSYGGLGGLCCGSTSDAVYGDFHYPNELGSGSGTYNGGGSGGGLVQITTATAQVDGTILANGGNSYDGGSGGGILLTVGTLSGSGQISANGGNGAGNDGGGGGRVAIYYGANTFDLSNNVTANGGAANSSGSVGTVYLQQTGSLGQLVIDNHGTPVGQWTPLGVATNTAFLVDNLLVAGTNVIVKPEHQMPVLAGSISITNGAEMTHQPTTTSQPYSLLLTVTNNLLVDGTSTINVSACGYLPGYTLGNTTNGAANNTAGGSYGGLGGICCSSTGNAVYGDYHNPDELGSGSGPYNNGASGGGLVQITAGTARVDGTILANGGNGYDGGSGGGILLNIGTLSGAGQINANGGAASADDGGGGGRVAIYYGANTFNLSNNATASGGQGSASSGSAGTVYLQQTGALGQLVINNYGTANGQWTPLGQTNDVVFTADALVLSGSGTMAATISGAPIQAGSVSLVNGAVLTHQPTTAAQAYSLLLTVTNNLLVDAASSINVSERGYLPGYTLGGTNVGGANNTAGGSYGGLGGLCCGSTSDAVYGDFRNPNELGSGSGNYNGGGPGGGLVQITAATAQVDGTILANGGNSYDGGSGGGILLTVGTLSGAGQISANGGAGNGDDGGGGGRVAIYYGTNTFDLSNNVAANGGAANSSGSVGTVYLQQTGSLGQLVIDNHGTPAGQWTPLGQATDVVVQVGSLVISGTNVVAAPEHQMSIEADFISITNGADLTHQVTTATQTYSLVLAATNTLLVDGTSTINVSGRGYLPGYTLGNTTNGAANNTAGGSYGGLGGLCCNSTTDPVYGSLYDPNNLGSGSGTYNGGGSGGGLVQITAGTAQVDGAILADGENAYDGGSGGGILMNVGTLIGAGQINANGGTASGNDGGGGGRVAIYTWTAMLMPSGNILANGGHGGSQSGQNGSDFVTTQPYIAFLNVLQYWHGIEQIAWSTMGVNPNGGDTAEILISKAGVTYFSQSVPASASLTWNTATVPDDNYTLSVKLLNAAGQTVGQISQNELINNSLAWHEGTLSTSQTWGTNAVNAVDQTVIIPSGVTLTIAPGAIVKFAPGAGIIIEAGGVLNASGSTFNAPIVFTSLADSSVGGDSDKDGDASVPLSGDWSGITGPGQFETSASVQVRYVIQTVSGTLTANQEWLGSAEYIIGGNITVPTNVTLTIDPGAIIKFELGYNLTVNSGGTLIANGTVAQPIVFTSINDESVGADTNTVITTPEAGDWDSIYLNGGQATLDHVSISYGGGPNSLNSALISIIAPGSVVSVSDSILNQGFYRGIEAEYGTANVTNCLVTGCQRGIQSGLSGPTVVNIINCTVDNNGIGIIGHGGVMNVANTIVSDSLQNGVYYCCGSSLALFEYCDVWSATGVNYTGAADQTGVNGNISANPDFVNAAQGNYELNYGSPCIDSADGAVGPLTDLLGAPGYNYPGLAVKTGIANADGIYPDMGAYEFSENAPSDVDLIVTSVIGPVQESAGQTVNVQWNDVNIGSGSAVGPWYDTLSLVSQNGSNTLAVATILVAQGLVLGPGQTYPASTTVEVPGGLDGPYQWQVQVNSKGDVFEGANSTNNTTLAAAPTTLTVPNLADGTVATNDLPGVGDYVWYSFVAPSNGDFQVTLDRTGGTAGISMYIGQGYVPNLQNFDVVAAGGASATLSALISDASSQPYYIAVYAASGAGTGFFTLDTGALNLALNSVTPSTLGNAGPATLTISGGELTSQMTYQVVDPHGGVHNATSVTVANPSLVYATFDFTGLPLGAYGLQINGGALTLHDALTLTGIPPGNLVLNITGPSLERPGRSSTLVVTYTNTGGGNMASPILFLDSDNGKFRLPGESVWVASQFQILAINTDGGPAGVLPPGYGGQIQVEFAQQTLSVGGTSHYTVSLADPNTNVNWAVLEQSIEPQLQPDASWGVIFTNFQAKVGNTYGQLQSALAQDATYLGQSGKLVADVLGLLTYEFEQGDNFGTITKRYHAGAFGLGMADPTDVSASSGSGEVVVQSSGLVRVFTIQPNGTYVGQPGDFGTVTETGGAVQLREKNGNITSFHSNGTLAYYQDPNGDRTNANYTGSLLTGFTDSFGNTISYTYNAGGHISQVTDPVGRVTTYTYDAPGQHVVQISNYLGAVGLSWITNQGAAQNNALASVTNPDGTHLYYQYDQNGRLTNQFRDGGAQSLSYTYASTGQVILADASGASITVSPDDSFKLGTYQNSLGIATVAGYDTNLDVTSLKNSAGQSITSDYDTNGNVVSSVDPLGYQLGSTYDPAFSKPTSVSDALGNQVTAQYDAHGNMLSETYPTGASDSYQYDSAGNVVARTNRRGHTTLFAYNAYNLVTNKTLPDNSMQTYTYDGHRNLISITDATGTTTYAYDAADRMTNVTYPNGHFLQFSYGAGNRRTQMVDQDGFTVNYSYDSVGRLAMLSDALDNAIVKYTYDAVGRVASKTFANGSVTTNVYSSNALLKSIVNLAANGTVLSSFDYAYDTLGRITNMTTPNGTFSYNYDEDNQLTSVNLSGGRGIQYQYDGNGNRTAVTDSGTNTTYLGNALNQYATIGAATFTYDADGNLISEADATGTNTYAYDDQNELVSFTSPAGIWTYQYNAVGQRVAMTQNGQTTDYVLDPFGLGNIVGEYQSGGALTAHYTYGLELASRVDSSGSAAYYTFDASGNTSGLIGQAGNLTDSYSYLPFGEKLVATGTTSNPFTFAGKVGVMDDGSGVYSMRARFYDPSQGRFLSTDPGHVLSPNLYNYGNNNPLAFVDATGSDPTSEANGANNLNNALNLGANINNAVNNGLNGPGTPSDTTSTVTGVAGEAATGGGSTVATAGGVATTAVGGTQAVVFGGLSQLADNNTLNAEFNLPELGGNGGKPPSGGPPGGGVPGGGNNPSGGQTSYPGPSDPNDKVTSGFGTEGYVTETGSIYYTIDFANETNAATPAAEVVVTDQLDTNLNWSTFTFQTIAFNNVSLSVPNNVQSFAATSQVSTDPNPVHVTATFNPATGVATWVMESIDPVTQSIPANPLAGFLPPDNALHQGEGYLTYSVETKAGLTAGTQITNQAVIVFDVNPPIATGITTNAVDAAPPVSSMTPLPALSALTFTVSWSGSDAGPGIAGFDIYVSTNSGPWTPWLVGTTNTSAPFSGINSNSYAFYSVAYDQSGLVQPNPTIPGATTVASSTVPPSEVLNIVRSAPTSLTLTWAQGALLQATKLDGPWTTNTSTSPYTVAATNSQMYFKVLEN